MRYTHPPRRKAVFGASIRFRVSLVHPRVVLSQTRSKQPRPIPLLKQVRGQPSNASANRRGGRPDHRTPPAGPRAPKHGSRCGAAYAAGREGRHLPLRAVQAWNDACAPRGVLSRNSSARASATRRRRTGANLEGRAFQTATRAWREGRNAMGPAFPEIQSCPPDSEGAEDTHAGRRLMPGRPTPANRPKGD